MPNERPLTPGEAIRRRRKELGLTQEALGKLTGIDRPAISGIERGRISVGSERGARIAGALETTTAELLLEDERPPLATILHRLQDIEGQADLGRTALSASLVAIESRLGNIEALLRRQAAGGRA